MGGNSSSAPADYLQHHWDRDVKELFSSVKISDPIGEYDFVVPISYGEEGGGEKQTHAEVFVTRSGKCALVGEALEVLREGECARGEVIGVFPFGESEMLVATGDGVALVECARGEFARREFAVADPKVCLPLSAESFVVASAAGNVSRVDVQTGDVQLLWAAAEEIIDAVLFRRSDGRAVVILVANDRFVMGFAEEGSPVVQNDECPKPRNMRQFNDENVIFSSESDGRVDIKLGRVNDDLSFDEFKTVLISKDAKITMLSSGTALIYNTKEINSFSVIPGMPPKSLRTSFPSNREIAKILVVRSQKPRIFIVSCKDGTVFVCKHPTFNRAEQTRKNENIEKYELTKYHREPIKFGCVVDEYSFLTFDMENVCILWESFPEWFKAPFILNMFDEPFDESYDLN